MRFQADLQVRGGLVAEEQPAPVLDKWPQMKGNLVWKGSELPQDIVWHLTPDQIEEVEFAASDFKDLDLDVPDVDQQNFFLPSVGRKLQLLCQDLHDGLGFFVIRGLNPLKYTPEDNLLMYLGISSYVGEERAKQDSRGNMVVHLHHDASRFPVDGIGPTKYSNKFSPFHSDNYADIVGLHVRETAAVGGAFKVASMWNVYNRMLASRPDLVEALAANWVFDRQGKLFPQVVRPILFLHEGRVLMDFSRNPVTGAQQDPERIVSRLSQVQTEALKEVEKIAMEDHVILNLQPGDMVFLNNHAVLHSREAFWNDSSHSRHIVRLWLKNTRLAWGLPPALDRQNRRIFYENEMIERWPVKPSQRSRKHESMDGDSPSGSH